MSFKKINTLFDELAMFCTQNEHGDAWVTNCDYTERGSVRPARPPGAVRANVCRAFAIFREDLAAARAELMTNSHHEDATPPGEEAAWMRLEWCEQFLTNPGKGPADVPKSPWAVVAAMANATDAAYEFQDDDFMVAEVASRFELAQLFPQKFDMRMVNADLREALDTLHMVKWREDGQHRHTVPAECRERKVVTITCLFRTGELTWTARGSGEYGSTSGPVFGTRDDPEAALGWGKWAQTGGAVRAGGETFAERALAALRERHYHVHIDGEKVRCSDNWIMGSRGTKVILQGYKGERDPEADAEEALMRERARERAEDAGKRKREEDA